MLGLSVEGMSMSKTTIYFCTAVLCVLSITGCFATQNVVSQKKDEANTEPVKLLLRLTQDVVDKRMKESGSLYKFCYERELIKDPDIYGIIWLYFVVDKDGSVSNVFVAQSTMNNRNVEQCLMQVTKQIQFPKHGGNNPVRISYPFLFTAADDQSQIESSRKIYNKLMSALESANEKCRHEKDEMAECVCILLAQEKLPQMKHEKETMQIPLTYKDHKFDISEDNKFRHGELVPVFELVVEKPGVLTSCQELK
jgi:hypothetical protein